uniref:Uncharacterized protein n=1 Tax=Helianthus annuus TaxID=4232 RepID=A0A251UIY8_HELAN
MVVRIEGKLGNGVVEVGSDGSGENSWWFKVKFVKSGQNLKPFTFLCCFWTKSLRRIKNKEFAGEDESAG